MEELWGGGGGGGGGEHSLKGAVLVGDYGTCNVCTRKIQGATRRKPIEDLYSPLYMYICVVIPLSPRRRLHNTVHQYK